MTWVKIIIARMFGDESDAMLKLFMTSLNFCLIPLDMSPWAPAKGLFDKLRDSSLRSE